MKLPVKTLYFALLSLAVVSLFGQTNEARLKSYSQNIVWGKEQQGLRGGLFSMGDAVITIYIQRLHTNSFRVGNNAAIPDASQARYIDRYNQMFLRTTNGLCPIELRDTTGKLIPPRDSGINNPTNYPMYFRWSTKLRNDNQLWRTTVVWIVWKNEDGTITEDSILQHNQIRLTNYFDLKESGTYQVTVWPMIYQRSDNPEDDRDVYQRLDLPPVETSIELRVAAPKPVQHPANMSSSTNGSAPRSGHQLEQ